MIRKLAQGLSRTRHERRAVGLCSHPHDLCAEVLAREPSVIATAENRRQPTLRDLLHQRGLLRAKEAGDVAS